MNKITFVLPITLSDLDIATNCIKSVLKNFKGEDIRYFIIIVPGSEYFSFQHFIHTIFNNLQYKIVLINEDTLQINCNIGWIKQQIIKLNISKFIDTENYMILDADCYLTKKISINDILVNNKPIVHLLKKEENHWLLNCCKYFNIDYNSLPEYVFHVTPQIFKSSIVRELIHKHNVQELITSNGCAEIFLYYCFILKNYNINDIYHIDTNKQLALMCIWESHLINKSLFNTIKLQFENKNVNFTLFQSIIKNIDIASKNDIIEYFINQSI